jgi:hypothetical protein
MRRVVVALALCCCLPALAAEPKSVEAVCAAIGKIDPKLQVDAGHESRQVECVQREVCFPSGICASL